MNTPCMIRLIIRSASACMTSEHPYFMCQIPVAMLWVSEVWPSYSQPLRMNQEEMVAAAATAWVAPGTVHFSPGHWAARSWLWWIGMLLTHTHLHAHTCPTHSQQQRSDAQTRRPIHNLNHTHTHARRADLTFCVNCLRPAHMAFLSVNKLLPRSMCDAWSCRWLFVGVAPVFFITGFTMCILVQRRQTHLAFGLRDDKSEH